MKRLHFLCAAAITTAMCACGKETTLQTNVTDALTNTSEQTEVSEPLRFESIDDLKDAISTGGAGLPVKSSEEFKSFTKTKMKEDGYDNNLNAILSDSFGSVLNQDGEVVFGNVLLKVGKDGIVYGPLYKQKEIRLLAETKDLSPLCRRSICPYLPQSDAIYRVDGYDDVFLLDTFGILDGSSERKEEEDDVARDNNQSGPQDDIATRSIPSSVIWARTETMDGPTFDRSYTRPSGSQKNNFSSNKRIANDTKIYKQDYGVYSETGVKTKTMRKRGLFWNKFTADVTSAVTDICIREMGNNPLAEGRTGWIDINETHYKGKSFMVATKVVSFYSSLPVTNYDLAEDCNKALSWCREQGGTVDSVDGVRYIIKSAPEIAVTRIKDIVVTKNDSKNTLIFNLETGYNSFYTDKGVLGNLTIRNSFYEVDMIYFYGYSEYNDEKRGAILKCRRLIGR